MTRSLARWRSGPRRIPASFSGIEDEYLRACRELREAAERTAIRNRRVRWLLLGTAVLLVICTFSLIYAAVQAGRLHRNQTALEDAKKGLETAKEELEKEVKSKQVEIDRQVNAIVDGLKKSSYEKIAKRQTDSLKGAPELAKAGGDEPDVKAVNTVTKGGDEVGTKKPKNDSTAVQDGRGDLASKRWHPGDLLRIRFLDGEPEVKKQVARFAQDWARYANLVLDFDDDADSLIRVSFLSEGDWSSLGRDAQLLPRDQQTMNFSSLTRDTSKEEYRRVVLRTFGLALGLAPEHKNPHANIQWNEAVVYRFYEGPPHSWTKAQIDAQLFGKFSDTTYKLFDPKSIMMFPIPEGLTTDGLIVGLNTDLSPMDKEYINQVYPFPPATRIEIGGSPVEEPVERLKLKRFQFEVKAPGRYAATVDGPPDPEVGLYGPGNEIDTVNEHDADKRPGVASLEQDLKAGVYYLKVRYFEAKPGDRFRVRVVPSPKAEEGKPSPAGR